MKPIDERRAQFKRYKEDVEKRGKPFHPYAMFHDTVMSLVVVSVIVALACIWYFTSGPEAGEDGAGWLGPRYTEEADPGTISFVPRPDWYFFFLFYLLRIFDHPQSVILGTVGIPTILLIIMIMLPFIDTRRERRLSRRPVAIVTVILTVLAMGTLTYKGATVEEAFGLGQEVVERMVAENNLPEEARPGAELFLDSGCTNCHTYAGEGSSNLGAPDLTDIGAQEGKTREYFQRYVADPSQFGNNVMPKYAELGPERLEQLSIFLEASKGAGG
jgi:menaquinol-cytochrome c reductase cytochrome b/c subunit